MTGRSLTRRRLGLYSMGVLLTGSGAFPLQPLLAQSVTLPNGACALTRRLSRGLRDGNAIVVTRTWRVTFAEQARGVAIGGEQMSVSVEAPPRLAPLAQIEEARSTEGIFPILLAPDGTIMAAGPGTSPSSVDAAIETAQSLLKASGYADGTVAQQGIYMAQLQKAGSSLLDEMPGDLFYPSTKPVHDVRQLALPDGTSGEFELTWQASVNEGTKLLETARREVITRIGSSERRSNEEWSLSLI